MPDLRRLGVYPLIAALLVICLLYSTQPVVFAAKVSHPMMSSQALLQPADLYHFSRLAKKLVAHNDKVSSYLWSKLSPETQKELAAWTPATPTDKVKSALVADLNTILRDPNFYSSDVFSDLKLRGTTKRLLEKRPSGENLVYLNRAVLENAFPGKIKISFVGKVFEDDADQAQAQADDAQAQSDEVQVQADQSQGEQQQQEQQQSDEQQAQADAQQGQADQVAENDVAGAQQADQAAAAADKGWTWGEFWANIVGGAVGGFLGGLTGGIVGGIVGALGGAVGGAVVSLVGYWLGSVPSLGITFQGALPQRALD